MAGDCGRGHIGIALLGRQFPGSWLPFGQEQVVRCADPYFELASSVSGPLNRNGVPCWQETAFDGARMSPLLPSCKSLCLLKRQAEFIQPMLLLRTERLPEGPDQAQPRSGRRTVWSGNVSRRRRRSEQAGGCPGVGLWRVTRSLETEIKVLPHPFSLAMSSL